MLQTERLILRPWTLDDAPAALAIYGDPEVMRFLHTPPADLDAALARIRRAINHYHQNSFGMCAVVEKATGRVVGGCGLKYLDGGPDVEVGYHLARAAWGRGYATEGARACVAYGFERLRLPRVVGICDPANHASRRVLEKAGMTYQGMGRFYNCDVQVLAVAHSGARGEIAGPVA